jgi:hypothetical protein
VIARVQAGELHQVIEELVRVIGPRSLITVRGSVERAP